MQFLNIVNAIAEEITAENIEKMISLVEKLIDLGINMEKHIESSKEK